MPRLSSAITGIRPTNASEKNENENSVSEDVREQRVAARDAHAREQAGEARARRRCAFGAARVRRPQQADHREEVRERVDREHRRRARTSRSRSRADRRARSRARGSSAPTRARPRPAGPRAARASAGSRSGPGAPSAFAMPIANTRPTISDLRRVVDERDARPARTRAPAARTATLTRNRRRSTMSASSPPERREEQQRSELREEDEADEAPTSRSASSAYAPSTTFCIHVPMFDANVPK